MREAANRGVGKTLQEAGLPSRHSLEGRYRKRAGSGKNAEKTCSPTASSPPLTSTRSSSPKNGRGSRRKWPGRVWSKRSINASRRRSRQRAPRRRSERRCPPTSTTATGGCAPCERCWPSWTTEGSRGPPNRWSFTRRSSTRPAGSCTARTGRSPSQTYSRQTGGTSPTQRC